jgi:hypothetical protein
MVTVRNGHISSLCAHHAQGRLIDLRAEGLPIIVGECDATPSKGIEVRRSHRAVAHAAKVVRAPLVRDDEYDILTNGHADVACV